MTTHVTYGGLGAWCMRLVQHPAFQRGTMALILMNAALVGLETSAALWARYGPLFGVLHNLLQAAFVAEIGLRIAAHGATPTRFFRDGWNVFDLIVVAVAFVPAAGPFATVARLARVFRTLRIVTGMPELRLLVTTMLRSIPSLANVALLLVVILYVYAVAGVHLFATADPAHWSSLPRAFLTLFEILTLEGWVELMDASIPATRLALPFYISYVVIAVFVMVNLFIAVVINNLQGAKAELEPTAPRHSVAAQLAALRVQLDDLEEALGPAARR